MKKRAWLGVVFVLGLSMTAPAWDVLGHSFIMEQVKGGPGMANGNEIYGIISPDFVNYSIGSPYYDWLYGQTHKNFLRVWNMAETPAEQALAMGFVAHNGVWGADYPAHVSSLTGDPAKGYIIAKAEALEYWYGVYGVWAQMGLTGDAYLPLRIELCHNIIEYIIDIQIWASDTTIASRVMAAAAGRDAAMQHLIKTAYAGLFVAYSQKTIAPLNQPGALSFLQTYETAFKDRALLYASIYAASTDVPNVVHNLSPYLAGLAGAIFGLPITPAQVEQILGLAMQLGLTNDVGPELEATVSFVHNQLAAHNIVYGSASMMKIAPRIMTKIPIKE